MIAIKMIYTKILVFDSSFNIKVNFYLNITTKSNYHQGINVYYRGVSDYFMEEKLEC